MLNLDTHVLIEALQGTLGRSDRELLGQHSWSISAIVLWELAKLVQLKRISVDLESPDFSRMLSRVHVWPLELRVCLQSAALDFRSDPADELIAATSIVHKVALLTRDARILRSKIVPFAK